MTKPKSAPLASVIIYNYNYGNYLAECLHSVVRQSYSNWEILFSDNASDDHSWEIALQFQKRYPDKIFVARNRKNFGTDGNIIIGQTVRRGKYHLVLGSDDVLHRDFLKKTVSALESHLDSAFVMTNRYILDRTGKSTREKPFYNGDYKLFPPSQAGVYMMAAVNPSISQILYRSDLVAKRSVIGAFATQYYGTRILDFRLSLEFPIIYLSAPLLGHRIHGENQSLEANSNLLEIIGPYVLNLQFLELARPFGFPSIVRKFHKSHEKLAKLSLRYCLRSLLQQKYELANRYLHLAAAIFPKIERTIEYKTLLAGYNQRNKDLLTALSKTTNLDFRRRASYAPDTPYDRI